MYGFSLEIYIFWQHNNESLTVVSWLDNNIVRILSSFHSFEILNGDDGVLQKRKVNKPQEKQTLSGWWLQALLLKLLIAS